MPDDIPYQAYKSKRHSLNRSDATLPGSSLTTSHIRSSSTPPAHTETHSVSSFSFPEKPNTPLPHVVTSTTPFGLLAMSTNQVDLLSQTTTTSSSFASVPSTSKGSLPLPQAESSSRRISTFRRVPARTAQSSAASSLRSSRQQTPSHTPHNSVTVIPRTDNSTLHHGDDEGSPKIDPQSRPQLSAPPSPSNIHTNMSIDSNAPRASPPTLATSPSQQSSTASSTGKRPIADISPRHDFSPTPASSLRTTPYRPGFQPKGAYRSLTDLFVDLRRTRQNGEEDRGFRSNSKRIERTKLERRLEKLVALHFPPTTMEVKNEKATSNGNVHYRKLSPSPVKPSSNSSSIRRWSSILDHGIGSVTLSEAAEAWRTALRSNEATNIRVAEQRITPWQDDAEANRCPLCNSTFHPITNRKHHCRLCGQIICSLPPKVPQRPMKCSLLFVIDPQSSLIQEVEESIDYGVKKSKTSITGKPELKQSVEEQMSSKGIRICRSCRPILLHQQYQREKMVLPTLISLHEAFINLEGEIEGILPKFQECIMDPGYQSLKEAAAVRKQLLEAFSRYDTLAKQIKRIPCPSGPGSSQEHVQMAILARATLFLQKHMLPLQSLNTITQKSQNATTLTSQDASQDTQADKDMASALQALLEQEALLESYVEEAKAHRKFEDVTTLRTNLAEIRREIDKLVQC